MKSQQTKDSSEYAGGLDQGQYGKPDAREMVARVWILRQSEEYIAYAGGLDQGRCGRAKC